MTFKEKNFQVIRNGLSLDLLHFLNINCEIHETTNYFHTPPTENNPYPINDPQSPNSFSWYGSVHSESLLPFLKFGIEQITDKKLHECYSYARNYYQGAILERHLDRPSAEYSVTICINKDIDWPIFMEDTDGVAHEIELNPGDMIVYRGDLLYHWRNPYTGKSHRQIFLHYVDANGKYSNLINDGRPLLGLAESIKLNR